MRLGQRRGIGKMPSDNKTPRIQPIAKKNATAGRGTAVALLIEGQRPGEGDRPLSGLVRRGTGLLPDCGVMIAGNPEMMGGLRLFKGRPDYNSVRLSGQWFSARQ